MNVPYEGPTMVETVEVNGRALVKGDEVSFKAVRGRFRFQYATLLPNGDVKNITVWGGDRNPKGRRSWRTFNPTALKTVHRKKVLH